jgi:ribose 5-phosphate isomerase RpiB
MKIGVIQASSQAAKNNLLYETVKRYAPCSQVVNLGCKPDEVQRFSYVEISVLVGLLLGSGSVDFVVTGCSSGQGMMLACNSIPGVLCGYAPSPMDAYLFAQINDGNAISIPLGEEYTWTGCENFEQTIAKLFSEPFGQGYPKGEAERKKRDTLRLKELRRSSQVSFAQFLDRLEQPLIETILKKRDVLDYILANGSLETVEWLVKQREPFLSK